MKLMIAVLIFLIIFPVTSNAQYRPFVSDPHVLFIYLKEKNQVLEANLVECSHLAQTVAGCGTSECAHSFGKKLSECKKNEGSWTKRTLDCDQIVFDQSKPTPERFVSGASEKEIQKYDDAKLCHIIKNKVLAE